jgi:lipopolysaccharide heptosyltransferase II
MKKMKRSKKLLAFVFSLIFAPIVYITRLFRGKLFKPVRLSETFKKILIIEMFGIGDFIMASSTFRALRERYPLAKITLLATPIFRDLAKSCPYFDNIVFFECPWPTQSVYKFNIKKLLKTIKCLRKEKFDIAIDLRGDLRNILLKFFLGAKYRVGYNIGSEGFLLTNKVPFNKTLKHQVDQNLNIAKFLGAEIKSSKPELWIENNNPYTNELLKSIEYKKEEILIGIHPGANWYARRWSPAKFRELIKKLNLLSDVKILLVVSPKEISLLKEIENSTLNVCSIITKNLKELAILIKKCHLLICNDSAPMHIATAVGTPVIALFGPQEPAFNGPYGNNNVILRYKVQCSPCTQNVCQKPQNSCMDNIRVEQVYESAVRKIQGVRKEMIDV